MRANHRYFFMTIKDRVYCLTSASILLPMSIFIATTTFRNVDQLSQVLDIYILTVRCAFAITGIVAGLLCTFVVVACPKRSLSLMTLLISILSTFGALITITTTIFSTDWSDKRKALSKTIFILTSTLSFAATIIICICLLNRFRREEFCNEDPIECIEHASCILAALFIISAFTSIIGFALGYTVSQQLVGIKILGGGSYSGIFGLLSTTLFIIGICIKRRLRLFFLGVSLGLGILALVSSSVSVYTEEMEHSQSISYIETNSVLFQRRENLKLMLLTKHTLVLVSSVFNLVFAAPMTVLICCLLKDDLLITSRDGDQTSIMMNDPGNSFQFSQLRTPLLQNCMQYSHMESSPILQSHLNPQQRQNQRCSTSDNGVVNVISGNPNNPSSLHKAEVNHFKQNIQTCDLLKQLSSNN